MEVDGGQAYAYQPTWIDRLRRWAFPRQPRPLRENDARTYLTTEIYVHVDWRDRVRLLWSGRVFVQVTTYTDVLVKDAESLSAFSVEP